MPSMKEMLEAQRAQKEATNPEAKSNNNTDLPIKVLGELEKVDLNASGSDQASVPTGEAALSNTYLNSTVFNSTVPSVGNITFNSFDKLATRNSSSTAISSNESSINSSLFLPTLILAAAISAFIYKYFFNQKTELKTHLITSPTNVGRNTQVDSAGKSGGRTKSSARSRSKSRGRIRPLTSSKKAIISSPTANKESFGSTHDAHSAFSSPFTRSQSRSSSLGLKGAFRDSPLTLASGLISPQSTQHFRPKLNFDLDNGGAEVSYVARVAKSSNNKSKARQ